MPLIKHEGHFLFIADRFGYFVYSVIIKRCEHKVTKLLNRENHGHWKSGCRA